MAALTTDPATERLARRLADATAKPLQVVVREAIEAKAEAEGVSLQAQHRVLRLDLLAQMVAITDGFADLPVLDSRDADAIIGFGEHGAPE